jgi:hypothetical protein
MTINRYIYSQTLANSKSRLVKKLLSLRNSIFYYVGRITQVTVSTCEDDVYIFDVRRQPKIILDGAVTNALKSKSNILGINNMLLAPNDS